MKKTLTILIAIFMATIMQAEDVIQIVPFKTTAGIEENDFEYGMDLELVNSKPYTAFQFDLFLPKGLTLQSKDDVDYSERVPGKIVRRVWTPTSHELDITKKDDVEGHYFVVFYSPDFEMFKDNAGTLITFYYLTSPDMTPGVYPIYVKNAKIAVDGDPQNGAKPENSVSYVTILDKDGNAPANSMIDLGDYMVPSFVESELPSQNVIRNGVCENLVLTDGQPFSAPTPFNAINASYSRTMTNKWGTIVLPYEVRSDEAVEYYSPSSIEGETLKLTKLDVLPANTPAIISRLSDDVISVNAQNVEVSTGSASSTSGSITMYGSYTNDQMIQTENSFYIKNNKFWKNNQYFYIDTFRAYFETESSINAKVLNIEDVEATSIGNVTRADGTYILDYYNMTGISSKNPQKGVNIMRLDSGKSKKVIVK